MIKDSNTFVGTLLVLLLATTVLCSEKKSPEKESVWEIGLFGSGTLAYDILGDYWESSPAGGAEIVYPFHPRVPVTLSVQGSNHRAEQSPADREGFHRSEYDLVMLHTTLVFSYLFNDEKPIQPYLGGGLTNTLFITYIDFPPPSNSDESEYGAVLTGGIHYLPNERFVLFCDYRQNLVFSSPHGLHFGTPRVGIRVKLFRKGDSHDS